MTIFFYTENVNTIAFSLRKYKAITNVKLLYSQSQGQELAYGIYVFALQILSENDRNGNVIQLLQTKLATSLSSCVSVP